MDKNDSMMLVLSELKGMRSDISTLTTDVAELKNGFQLMQEDIADLKADVAVLKADMIEVKEDVADIKVQQKENTRFISALIDGQTVIEIRFDTMHSDIHSDIYDLRARTSNLENVTGRILFNMESAKCANF